MHFTIFKGKRSMYTDIYTRCLLIMIAQNSTISNFKNRVRHLIKQAKKGLEASTSNPFCLLRQRVDCLLCC